MLRGPFDLMMIALFLRNPLLTTRAESGLLMPLTSACPSECMLQCDLQFTVVRWCPVLLATPIPQFSWCARLKSFRSLSLTTCLMLESLSAWNSMTLLTWPRNLGVKARLRVPWHLYRGVVIVAVSPEMASQFIRIDPRIMPCDLMPEATTTTAPWKLISWFELLARRFLLKTRSTEPKILGRVPLTLLNSIMEQGRWWIVLASRLFLLQLMHFGGDLTRCVIPRPLLHLSTLTWTRFWRLLNSYPEILPVSRAPFMFAGFMKRKMLTGWPLLPSLVCEWWTAWVTSLMVLRRFMMWCVRRLQSTRRCATLLFDTCLVGTFATEATIRRTRLVAILMGPALSDCPYLVSALLSPEWSVTLCTCVEVVPLQISVLIVLWCLCRVLASVALTLCSLVGLCVDRRRTCELVLLTMLTVPLGKKWLATQWFARAMYVRRVLLAQCIPRRCLQRGVTPCRTRSARLGAAGLIMIPRKWCLRVELSLTPLWHLLSAAVLTARSLLCVSVGPRTPVALRSFRAEFVFMTARTLLTKTTALPVPCSLLSSRRTCLLNLLWNPALVISDEMLSEKSAPLVTAQGILLCVTCRVSFLMTVSPFMLVLLTRTGPPPPWCERTRIMCLTLRLCFMMGLTPFLWVTCARPMLNPLSRRDEAPLLGPPLLPKLSTRIRTLAWKLLFMVNPPRLLLIIAFATLHTLSMCEAVAAWLLMTVCSVRVAEMSCVVFE